MEIGAGMTENSLFRLFTRPSKIDFLLNTGDIE
jgi:hypothetical protein